MRALRDEERERSLGAARFGVEEERPAGAEGMERSADESEEA